VEDVELHGRHELQRILSEEAVVVKLPLLVLDGVVSFPGDTLPLMIPPGKVGTLPGVRLVTSCGYWLSSIEPGVDCMSWRLSLRVRGRLER
jgi:hypothetical protein